MPPFETAGGTRWEWLPEHTNSKEPVRFFPLPPSETEYADPIDQDLKPVQKSFSAKGFGLNQAEYDALLAAQETRGQLVQLTNARGVTLTGIPVSISAKAVTGCAIYDVTIQIRI